MKDIALLRARNIIRIWLSIWGLYLTLGIASPFVPHTGNIPYLVAAIAQVAFWFGAALTVLVLILFYQGKAADSKFNPMWIVYTCIGAWCVFLLILGSGRFIPSFFARDYLSHLLMMSMQIGWLLILPAIAVAFLGIRKQHDKKEATKPVNHLVVQAIAGLVILSLITCTYAAIRTLLTPIDDGKFTYNGIANGAGLAALVFVMALSYLQHDVYWLSRGRTLKLDERQVQERQQVFETSYKLGTALVFIGFCTLFVHKQNIATLAQNDSFTPGNILWPFACVVMALFALPLLVATYKRR